MDVSEIEGLASEREVMKVLYESRADNLKFLAERSFATTIQGVTLNLLIVAALVASEGRIEIPADAKPVATAMLAVFNLLVIFYLVAKGLRYRRFKAQLRVIESEMIVQCPSLRGKRELDSEEKPYWKRMLWDGTALFCVVIIGASACSIYALWL